MEYALSELFTLQMGKTPSRDNSSYWGKSENSWISIADLTNSGKYISNTKETLSDSAVAESGIKKIPANTVIMSFKLSLGKVAITEKEMYSNEAIMAFIDKGVEKISPEYLYYLLRAKDWSKGTNKAVMGATLNKATLSTIKIQLHEYDNQLEIVNMLNRVSSSIDFRKQQLTKLDELIKARFVEMFGDFEFNPKKFPIYLLCSLCDVGSSKRIYQEEQSTSGIPFLKISDLVDLIDAGTFSASTFIPLDRYERLCSQGLTPKTNDVLITSRGTLGKCYIVKKSDEFYFQDGMISWLSNISEKVSSTYISYLFMQPYIQKQILALQAGSTVAYLSISMLKRLNIILPPLSLQNQFADFVAEVDKSKLLAELFAQNACILAENRSK